MDLCKDYFNFQIHAFWSKDISALIAKITSQHGKSYATQHDLVLNFINDTLFEGKGELNKEFREKGKSYPDLKIPLRDTKEGFEIVELKVRTSQLKYLRGELNKREKVFSTSDHFYFSYILQIGSKGEGKIIKDRACIYYLVIIKISKQTKTIPINDLVDAIKMGTDNFTKELAEKSGLDEEKEELLGVENMIKVVDLERKVSMLESTLDEKDKILIEERIQHEEAVKEKDKEIQRLKNQLKEK